METNYRVGDRVFIVEDPDNYPFSGSHGSIEEVGVPCLEGMGVIVNLVGWGPCKVTYEMLGRVQ